MFARFIVSVLPTRLDMVILNPFIVEPRSVD